jgi:hypothetical protein
VTKLSDMWKQVGVKLTNRRWSASGIDANGKVWVTMWADNFSNGTYISPPPVSDDEGFKPRRNETVANLKLAIEKHGGVVGVIIIGAEDVNAHPRKVKLAKRAATDWRIIAINETIGFTAVRAE